MRKIDPRGYLLRTKDWETATQARKLLDASNVGYKEMVQFTREGDLRVFLTFDELAHHRVLKAVEGSDVLLIENDNVVLKGTEKLGTIRNVDKERIAVSKTGVLWDSSQELYFEIQE